MDIQSSKGFCLYHSLFSVKPSNYHGKALSHHVKLVQAAVYASHTSGKTGWAIGNKYRFILQTRRSVIRD